jgi:hypothetical protein
MMTLNFKRNTWHWKLAKMGGLNKFTKYKAGEDGWYERDEKGNVVETYDGDFCQYTRCVIAGAAAATVLTVVVGGLTVLVSIFPLGFIYWLYQIFEAGKLIIPNPPATIFMIVAGLSALVSLNHFMIWPFFKKAMRASIEREADIKDTTRVPPKPSFLKEAYLKFKEKTCKRVVIQ